MLLDVFVQVPKVSAVNSPTIGIAMARGKSKPSKMTPVRSTLGVTAIRGTRGNDVNSVMNIHAAIAAKWTRRGSVRVKMGGRAKDAQIHPTVRFSRATVRQSPGECTTGNVSLNPVQPTKNR